MREHPVPRDIQLDEGPIWPPRRANHQIRAFAISLSNAMNVGGFEAYPTSALQHWLVCPLLCGVRGNQALQFGGDIGAGFYDLGVLP